MKKIIITTDGASRGNPGHAAYGFTIADEVGKRIYQEGKYIGTATNNVAEYTAVLQALKWVKDNIKEQVSLELFADSKLVAEQLSGRFKVKHPNLKPLFSQIKMLEMELGVIRYIYVPREQNFTADNLANQALDNQ